jgi:hypothetical protein
LSLHTFDIASDISGINTPSATVRFRWERPSDLGLACYGVRKPEITLQFSFFVTPKP